MAGVDDERRGDGDRNKVSEGGGGGEEEWPGQGRSLTSRQGRGEGMRDPGDILICSTGLECTA